MDIRKVDSVEKMTRIADEIVSDREKAVCVRVKTGYAIGYKDVWFPKSVLAWSNNGNAAHFHPHLFAKNWFLQKNGLWWVTS